MTGLAYLATGMILILGSLVMLGLIMGAITNSYYVVDGQMPTLVAWFPFFFLLVGVGWGAFAIYKGVDTAGRLSLHLLGGAVSRIFQLHRASYKFAILFGGIVAMTGFVIVCVEVAPEIFADTLPGDPTMAIVGIALIFLGVATVEYTAAKREQELATKT